jgi:beta-glucanase (GH16 family)
MPKLKMKNKTYKITLLTIVASLFFCGALFAQPQIARDNFEGNSTIFTWFGDNCILDTSFNNPYPLGINTSSKVLKYADVGGQYANVRFDTKFNLNLGVSSQFSLKLYVPSSGITGSQNNQISLKLQNGLLASPWETQCEIIKPIVLNQWQTITFDFATDPFINLSPSSPNPIDRSDFSRVLIQINGENNNSNVLAFIDDFLYISSFSAFNNLIWSDDFDSSGAVNNSNWFHQTQLPNGSGWYNGELQHYTNHQSNSFVSNGVLNIVAKKETFTDQGQTKQFTSARLNSKFAFKYGRVEVRAKLPTGAGTWPAIWMLGKSINEPGGYWAPTNGSTNWPACGEIDIMEHWGTNQNVISSAIHFPINGNLNVGQYVTNAQYKAGVSSDFHIYAVEWTEQKIVFSVDGINHFTYNPSVKNQYTWPFDAEQYILLNFAIEPSITNSFMQSAMEVDYVRVYQKNCSPTTSNSAISRCGSYNWNGNTYSTSGTYTWTGKNVAGCDSIATLNLTVVSTLPAITGASSVCAGSTTTLSNAISGGVWYTQATSQATINAYTGLLTAKNAGTITIQYIKAGCGSVAKLFTINPIPVVPTITYASGTVGNLQAGAPTGGFCVGKVFTVVGTPNVPAGTWSATGFASITSGGLVSIVGVGAGSIKYTYTNANGCSNSRIMSGSGYTCAAREVNTVDGQRSTVNDFTIYPNPTKGLINLNVETIVGKGSIIVNDLYGKTVKTQTLSMGTNTVNVSNLCKGMYIITMTTTEGKISKKLIIE